MRWWRWTVLGWSGVAVLGCLWLSGWLLLLIPRAVDHASNPFQGSGALLLSGVALAVIAAGALFAHGGLLLWSSPREGRGRRPPPLSNALRYARHEPSFAAIAPSWDGSCAPAMTE